MASISGLQKTTDYKVVIPFYIYACFSVVIGTLLLLLNTDIIDAHYFNPHTLAITHTMALGWGTMTIFGASYQLLPVLIEGEIDSNLLGYLTFIFAAIGIPILVYGFYQFDNMLILQIGGSLINIAVICYLVNVMVSSFKSDRRNVHAWFMIVASAWLLSTTFFGLLLAFNFTRNVLPSDSVSYLTIHAHLGLVGWFLLLVMGVGSKLIPLFLISKYKNDKELWMVFALINISLISFLVIRIMDLKIGYYLPIGIAFLGIALFANYCREAYVVRIRKSVDYQVKLSIASIAQMLLPVVALLVVLTILPASKYTNIVLLYGFCIFFGWITAIIYGMTFKTMPFIVWNKVYYKNKRVKRPPAPKELFDEQIFRVMMGAYIIGFFVFATSIILKNLILAKLGAAVLLFSAVLYAFNSIKSILHKPIKEL